MLRLGLVGTGAFAARLLTPAIRASSVRFRSVLSREAARAQAFAQAEGAERGFSRLEELLADPELDAVWVATPDPTHEELVLAAARAGKHVLCEKPLSISAASARRMRDGCAAAGVKLGVAYHCRHHPAHLKLFELLARGDLGRVLRVRTRFTIQMKDASNWRARSPNPWWAMAAIGTHLVDFSCAILGEGVKDVFARFSSPVFSAENEELALVSLGFEDGASADVEAALCLAQVPSRLEVIGTKGWVVSDGTIGPRGGKMLVNGEALAFEDGDPYRGELEDFARACAEGREPAVSGAMGARNVEVLEAAKRSAREGTLVRPERG